MQFHDMAGAGRPSRVSFAAHSPDPVSYFCKPHAKRCATQHDL